MLATNCTLSPEHAHAFRTDPVLSLLPTEAIRISFQGLGPQGLQPSPAEKRKPRHQKAQSLARGQRREEASAENPHR